MLAFGGPNADSWTQVLDLAAAFVLCGIIGLERELRHKDAGLRTLTMIGVSAALFMQISKFGFGDVLGHEHVSLDPSRVASLVVSGIGFIGAGLIFVRRGDVRGLTTAATVWLATAVGLACGADLIALGAILTGIHLVIVFGFGYFERPTRSHQLKFVAANDAALDAIVHACAERSYEVLGVKREPDPRGLAVTIMVKGDKRVERLYSTLHDLDGVVLVAINEPELAAPS